jgi:DNA polymerase I-like protein with 3'-5' exonuclease and polymerase domains
MRADSVGFFWEDLPQERTRGEHVAVVRPMPAIPDTGWRPPSEFPRLEAAKVLAIDCETKDPNLLEHGPGSIRRDGHIVGISVGTEDGARFYFPMRHEVGGMNMDAEQVLRWAADELTRPGQTKVGANLMYDAEWLASEGVDITKGDPKFIDVQWQEALLDENAKSYALEALGQKYLGEGKASNSLYEWCSKAYGGQPNGKQRANIYRAPASLVGPYAESDVDLPLRIAALQKAALAAEGLDGVAELENALIPMLLAMRRRGVRVDREAGDSLSEELSQQLETMRTTFNDMDIWSAASIAAACDVAGAPYLRTAKGNPSFTSAWLAAQEHPFLVAVNKMRRIDKLRGTFIEGHALGHLVNGRVHAQFHPLRGDDNGTVSGRFSSSLPNLQNIPSRDDELAPLIRGLFLPDEGQRWARFDWSQIEYRLLVHYARGGGADAARRQYRDDPTTDFHRMVSELTGIDRKPAKNINFGLVYGMGVKKMAASLGRSEEATRALFEQYHTTLPFVKSTFDAASQMAAQRGYTRTLLGRRRRFELWEPRQWDKDAEACGKEAATAAWGVGIRRAYTHKALNSILQGGAADIMKQAMVDIWKAGVCKVLGAPLVTVHDELGWSAADTPQAQEALAECQRIMETCVTLRVPLRAEREEGPSWGQLEAVK